MEPRDGAATGATAPEGKEGLSSEPEPRRAEGKRIAGLAIRTTNAAEFSPATAKIPALWGRFASERWADKLERIGGFGPVTAVYSAYESDVSGSYQLLVGRQVSETATLVEPLQVVSAAPGSYLMFRCVGPLPQAVIDGWRDVWAYFSGRAPARAYTYDLEICAEAGAVEIWVAV